jgi:hypothetical protein
VPWATFFRPLRGLTYSTDLRLRTLLNPQNPSFLGLRHAAIPVCDSRRAIEQVSQFSLLVQSR